MHHNEDHRISLLCLELSVNLFISHPNYEEIRQVALLTTEVNTSKHKKRLWVNIVYILHLGKKSYFSCKIYRSDIYVCEILNKILKKNNNINRYFDEGILTNVHQPCTLINSCTCSSLN